MKNLGKLLQATTLFANGLYQSNIQEIHSSLEYRPKRTKLKGWQKELKRNKIFHR